MDHVRTRTRTRLTATGLALVVVAAACGGSSSKSGGKSTTTKAQPAVVQRRSVTVWPLAYTTSGGTPHGVSTPLEVDIAPSSDGKLRVSFSEDEVSGTGDQWRAAAWNTVTVGTLLTGAPLRGKEFTFKLKGRIDGPSAGTLMTIAVISLIRGDTLRKDVTMTGTVNPDGTTGPVGGIPYKVQGVVAAHKTKMLIPLGQRNSPDDAGKMIDVVQEGRSKHIAVSEVGDIYDAYQQFTGVTLPKAGSEGSVHLSERAYQNLKAKVDDKVGQVKSDAAEIDTLDQTVVSDLASLLHQAQASVDKATKLEDEGLQAGAFQSASEAAAIADATLETGRLLETYLGKGRAAFLTQLKATVAIDDKVTALFESLKAFTPETVSDVGALSGAYGNAVDALSLSEYGDGLLASLDKATSATEEAQLAVEGAFFKTLALSELNYAKDVFDVGRGLGGAKLGPKADVAGTADFFRKAAEANLQAFNTVVVADLANSKGMSEAQATAALENQDLQYALANSSLDVIEGGIDRFLEAPASDYARLGGALQLYARTSYLIDKYYSLQAQVDSNGNVTGVVFDAALSNAIDLARSQVERSVSLLTSQGIDPTLQVGSYEIAGIEREGSVDDKLSSLADYRLAFMSSRVLAYLGGFADKGLGSAAG